MQQINYIQAQKYWEDNNFIQYNIPFDIYIRVCWVIREQLKNMFVIKEGVQIGLDEVDSNGNWVKSLYIELDEIKKLKMIFDIIRTNFVLSSIEDREDLIKQYYNNTYKENETAEALFDFINWEALYEFLFYDATYIVLPKFYVEEFTKKYFVVDNETGYYLFRI
jgi:hypothetical protein